jgi:cell division protein FtsQ
MPQAQPKAGLTRAATRALGALGVLALLGAAALSVDWHELRNAFPVEYFRVEGDILNLEPESLEQALLPEVRGGFLLTDLAAIEAAARQEAWVDRVETRRIWPDTLVIRVEEQIPAARWGGDSLLNGRGERFTPRRVQGFDDLPRLSGPDGQERTVLAMLRALDLKLKPRRLHVEALSLSNRRAWTAEVSGGTELVFGHQDPLVAMNRLLALLPKIGEDRLPAMRRLDLRYPNGFAVVWKPPVNAESEPLTGLCGPGPARAATDLKNT